MRILFVFAWLAGGGEETQVRLLVRALDPARYQVDVVACFRKESMPDPTHARLEAIGVRVDTMPYHLSMDETVVYLAGLIPSYDAVVSCQNVADIYPALEGIHLRPPLIEHGGFVSEALAGPKHFTARYVGICASIRDAAASRMPGREADAVEIPSMVDMAAFDPAARAPARAALGIPAGVPLVGWVGRLDAKTCVADFIAAAARVHAVRPEVRFVVIGGPDASMPDHAVTLRLQATALGLDGVLTFPDDRADAPELLSALDIFVWLPRGEGMPHVLAKAGAASLPVIATADDETLEQIEDGLSGLFVPHDDPAAVAAAMLRLLDDAPLRRRLGAALHAKVRADYSVEAVVPQWQRLFDAVRRPVPEPAPPLFRSAFLGGFECSTHRRAHDRRRVDVIAATRHDVLAEQDYRALQRHGILTVRDGLRWHRIEREPGRYDWSSLEAQLAGAAASGTEVIWDLLHYGWPDEVDVWSPAFVPRFAAFAAAAARVIGRRTTGTRFYCPVNEISFLSWGGGDVAYLNPFAHGRGFELKVQLARAAIVAMDAIRAIDPDARFVHVDPVINVIADPLRPHDVPFAEGHRRAQFQGWDLIAGRICPQIGGRPDLLDIVGVNYYHNNQWIHSGPQIDRRHPLHKPFRRMLAETYARYGRPIFIAETGIEGDARPEWLAHVCSEVREAQRLGVPVAGLCLYPILDHPGWDDERPCPNGLLRDADRAAYVPLADELRRQRSLSAAQNGEAGMVPLYEMLASTDASSGNGTTVGAHGGR